jgi:serine/threonine protein kinase
VISSLSHPHICTLFDVGEAAPLHYLVMEYLEGEALADRLQKGPFPFHDVLKYGQQIASALHAAHRQGVTHRDLKPGNVMLTKSGAKLLDFGLAKMAAEGGAKVDGQTNLATEAKPLTEQGTILGTFQYMSPEQLEGQEADARTDIFALGAVLYEMATGRRAFEKDEDQPDRRDREGAAAADRGGRSRSPRLRCSTWSTSAWRRTRRSLAGALDVASELRWIGTAGSQAGVAAKVTSSARAAEPAARRRGGRRLGGRDRAVVTTLRVRRSATRAG